MIKIMLDPGHGGDDPGALGGGWKEKNINLEAALTIGPRLVAHGFEVGYTRITDIDPDDEYYRGRSAKGYDYFLSIHCNAGGGTGAEVYANTRETYAYTEMALRDRLKPLVGWRKIGSRRYDTGEFLTRTADERTRMFTNGAAVADWYGVLRGCWSVGVSGDLLELFFIDNADDRAQFDADRKGVYEAVVRAICEAFGAEYVPFVKELKTDPVKTTDEDAGGTEEDTSEPGETSEAPDYKERVEELIRTDPTVCDAQERSLPPKEEG